MNQYIITEEELEEWEAGGMCWSEEQDLHRSIRSHPYNPQAEREKVLDRIEMWCEGYFNTGYEGSVGELNDIKRYIKQLRQEGKQEQP